MKLVIATPLYPPEIGGPATYAHILEKGLPGKGIEIEVIKFSEVRHLPKLIRHYAYFRRVLSAARNADAVLALDPVSVGLPAMRAAHKAGKPFFVKVVGDYAWEQGRQRFGVTEELDAFVKTSQRSFFVRKLQKIQTMVAQNAKHIIVPSEYLKGIVVAWGIPKEKIIVIYNGVELPEMSASHIPAKGFSIVSSGRRVPWKGFEALERVVAREPNWHLMLLQGLPRTEALERIRNANVFVLNSDYEGLSHALIEAMMLRIPVVATRVGGNTELIEDGKTGLLIPPRDDEALYAALKQVADNPDAAQARAIAGFERIATLFSVQAMLTKTADFLTFKV